MSVTEDLIAAWRKRAKKAELALSDSRRENARLRDALDEIMHGDVCDLESASDVARSALGTVSPIAIACPTPSWEEAMNPGGLQS